MCGDSSCSRLEGGKWQEVAQLTEKRFGRGNFLEGEKWKGLEGVNRLWFLNYSDNGVEMKRNRQVSHHKNNRPQSFFLQIYQNITPDISQTHQNITPDIYISQIYHTRWRHSSAVTSRGLMLLGGQVTS